VQGLKVRIEDLERSSSSDRIFRRSPVHVGRNELNELVLAEPFVSQWHAIVRFDDAGVQYVDLGSTNGTVVDGARLSKGEPVPVQAGLDLRIGSLRLHFEKVTVPEEVESDARSKTQFRMRAVQPLAEQGTAMIAASVAEQPRAAPAPASRPFQAPPAPAPTPGSPVQQLFSAYVDYRKAYLKLHQGITERLTGIPSEERIPEVKRLLSRFPALSQEKPFQELLQSLAVPLPAVKIGSGPTVLPERQTPGPTPAPEPSGKALEGPISSLLTEFVRCYLPNVPLTTPADAEKFLDRMAEVVEAFGKAFVELQKGQEQFGDEMSIGRPTEMTPLHRAKSAREVLAYLLDWRVAGNGRVQELIRGFAEVMIHQVALLNGMRAGARALLERLGPSEIDQALARAPVRVGAVPLPARLWPFRSYSRWTAFVSRHQMMLEEEQEVTSALFGRDFAKAYALVAGEREDVPTNGKGGGR
jgi:type VI secretion system FHA domain protein